MTTEKGAKLAQGIRAAVAELASTCAGVDEATALIAPAGRWSPKEILSHITGPDERGVLALLQMFAAADTPRIDIVPEQTYMTETRRAMSFAALAELAAERYGAVARYAEELNEEQFARTAHIPLLKQSPLGEFPTLEMAIGGFGQYHLKMHIDHLREVLAALNTK
jgi:hypothetical protein